MIILGVFLLLIAKSLGQSKFLCNFDDSDCSSITKNNINGEFGTRESVLVSGYFITDISSICRCFVMLFMFLIYFLNYYFNIFKISLIRMKKNVKFLLREVLMNTIIVPLILLVKVEKIQQNEYHA